MKNFIAPFSQLYKDCIFLYDVLDLYYCALIMLRTSMLSLELCCRFSFLLSSVSSISAPAFCSSPLSNHVNFCIILGLTCIEILEWLPLSNKLCRLKWQDDNGPDYSGRNCSKQWRYCKWRRYNDGIINNLFDDIVFYGKYVYNEVCIICYNDSGCNIRFYDAVNCFWHFTILMVKEN